MNSATLVQPTYKPKTAVTEVDEIVEPGEFYFFHADRFLLRGQIRKHDDLTMRQGCLAEEGDLVQLAGKPTTIDNIAVYQSGIKYTAVCVMVGRSMRRPGNKSTTPPWRPEKPYKRDHH